MATRADPIHDRRTPERPQRDTKAPARPLKTRVTSVDAVIDRAIETNREALAILAKR